VGMVLFKGTTICSFYVKDTRSSEVPFLARRIVFAACLRDQIEEFGYQNLLLVIYIHKPL
jgi:hypothetical protein